MDSNRMIWIEAQAGGPVTVTSPTPLYPLTYTADSPSERHFTRHPACSDDITDAMLSQAYVGRAEKTINLDGTVSHTWTLPLSAPPWDFQLRPLMALVWPAIDRAIYGALRAYDLDKRARRTTARHQRRNKAWRHR